MWRTGRTPPWAPALTGALLLLLATPLWSQQDGGMDFDQVTGGEPPPAAGTQAPGKPTPFGVQGATAPRPVLNWM